MKPYYKASLECCVRLLRSCENAMGWCTAQCKLLLLSVKMFVIMQFLISPSDKEEEEEKEER